MNQPIETYEVASPSFSDIQLDQQIEFGICNWVSVDSKGREFFGATKTEAVESCCKYN